METKYYILLSIYLVFTIIIQFKIVKNVNFAPRQKRIHSILLWFLPFVWGILVIASQRVLSNNLKRNDKTNLHDSEYSDNWINLTGTGGH
jgi:hypothetical protein